jgi:sulfonate transport system substrate-binding protein
VKYNNHGNKKMIIALVFGFVFFLSACSGSASTADSDQNSETIRIGYQKNGTTLLLRQNEQLEQALNEKGYTVEWSEFNTASSVLEALNADSVDFANAGDAPSVMALSRGMDFQFIVTEPSSPDREAILIPEDSTIQSIKDLKGKKIAYNQASIAQYLLAKALEAEGLTLDEVESVYLPPSDASIAFANGEVDAWVTWDPYMTVAQEGGNKILTTGEGIVPLRSFFVASNNIIENELEAVNIVVDHVKEVGSSIDEDPTEAANVLEESTNIEASIWKIALSEKINAFETMDQEAIDDLQTLTTDLKEIEMISETVDIESHVWQPE